MTGPTYDEGGVLATGVVPPEVAHARTTDPETSHEAAETVDVRTSQAEVLRLLELGPATDEELAGRAYRKGVRMSPSGLRSRRAELVDKGLAEHTGEHKLTKAKRRTRVWRAVPQ